MKLWSLFLPAAWSTPNTPSITKASIGTPTNLQHISHAGSTIPGVAATNEETMQNWLTQYKTIKEAASTSDDSFTATAHSPSHDADNASLRTVDSQETIKVRKRKELFYIFRKPVAAKSNVSFETAQGIMSRSS